MWSLRISKVKDPINVAKRARSLDLVPTYNHELLLSFKRSLSIRNDFRVSVSLLRHFNIKISFISGVQVKLFCSYKAGRFGKIMQFMH